MNATAIALLDELLRSKEIREKRSLKLLSDFREGLTDGWYMSVRSCFRDALDIRLDERVVDKQRTLVWTQGLRFSFKEGDIIYDTPLLYDHWAEGLRVTRLGLQVTFASEATPAQEGVPRLPGHVRYDLLLPNADRTKLQRESGGSCSQDEFVRMLIQGPSIASVAAQSTHSGSS